MKNLELFNLTRQSINISREDAKHIAFVKNEVYVIRDGVLIAYRDGPGEEVVRLTLEPADVIQFEYLFVEQSLWIGTTREFVCINPNEKLVKKIGFFNESSCDAELLPLVVFDTAVWNPEQNALVIIKQSGELGVYGVSFDAEVLIKAGASSLHDVLPQVQQLGWGSADRQFRSPEEIALADSLKGEEPIPDGDCTTKVSWRGNGEMFAVNYYADGIRKLKVYKYPCELMSESDCIVGLQSVIAWKPTGNSIAVVVWTTKRCQLTIYEKNCLVRCSFDLARKEYVKQLKWSYSGDILAVHHQPTNDNCAMIDLYYFNNSVMYLKQRLQFQEVNPLIDFDLLKSPSTLCVLRATTLYEAVTYTFKFVYYSGPVVDDSNLFCIVINGCRVHVTNCKDGMIPPPMSSFTMNVPSPVNFVIFHPTKRQVAFIDCCDVITVFDISEDKLLKLQDFQLEGELGFTAPLKFHQFVWSKDDVIICMGEKVSPHLNSFDIFHLNMHGESDKWKFVNCGCLKKGVNIAGFLENENFVLDPYIVHGTADEQNLPFFSEIDSLHVNVKLIFINKRVYVFSQSANNSLFINGQEVLQGIISFIIYKNCLFLSTVKKELISLRLNEHAISEFAVNNFRNVCCCQIEQGSSLVCGVPCTSYIAMEMPRGNIEMRSCRMLVIDQLEKWLAAERWVKAVDVTRIEKLDMNVLVDLNFNRFIQNVGKFIEAVRVPSVLNDFLLGLQDENIFNTTYRDCALSLYKEIPGKREFVCQAMIQYMEKNSYMHYVGAIITACFVMNSPTSVGEALHYVASLLEYVDEKPSVIKAAEEAFKSACTMRPNKEIYETALLTYNFDLILFVARNLEMDPLEYEPFIDNLRSLDPCRCRFKINDFLKRYFQAFQYLLRCARNDEEVLNYVKECRISDQAVWHVKPGTSLHTEISRVVGTNLLCINNFEEAAVIFHRAKLYEDALDSYKRGLMWKEAIDIMQEMHLPENRFISNLNYLAQCLKIAGRLEEASEICEKYLNDYETAIKLCISDKLFSRAVALANKHKRKDIYECAIVDGIYQHCSTLWYKFKFMLDNFSRYKKRLCAVRAAKKSAFEMQLSVEIVGKPDCGDDVSSIIGSSTVGSIQTSSSRISSRSRRKQERKKHSMREGSMYEDIALMEALYNLIQEAFEWGPKVRELCIILCQIKNLHKLPEKVISMYSLLSHLQQEMLASIQDIWPPNMNNINSDPADVAVFENVNILDAKFRMPPNNRSVSWKLATFPTVAVGDQIL